MEAVAPPAAGAGLARPAKANVAVTRRSTVAEVAAWFEASEWSDLEGIKSSSGDTLFRYTEAQLRMCFGLRGCGLYNALRAIDSEPDTPRRGSTSTKAAHEYGASGLADIPTSSVSHRLLGLTATRAEAAVGHPGGGEGFHAMRDEDAGGFGEGKRRDDAAAMAFTRGALALEEPHDSRVLDFKTPMCTGSNDFTGSQFLFVRPCYAPLFAILMGWAGWAEDSHAFVFLSGSPGCGKSKFRNYVFWRLMHREENWFVVFAKWRGDAYEPPVYVCGKESSGALVARTFDNYRDADLWLQRVEGHALWLVDASSPTQRPPRDTLSGSYVLLTPAVEAMCNKKAAGELYKDGACMYWATMPLWTVAELQTASRVGMARPTWADDRKVREGLRVDVARDKCFVRGLELDASVILYLNASEAGDVERLARVSGGVARFVFGTPAQRLAYLVQVAAALAELTSMKDADRLVDINQTGYRLGSAAHTLVGMGCAWDSYYRGDGTVEMAHGDNLLYGHGSEPHRFADVHDVDLLPEGLFARRYNMPQSEWVHMHVAARFCALQGSLLQNYHCYSYFCPQAYIYAEVGALDGCFGRIALACMMTSATSASAGTVGSLRPLGVDERPQSLPADLVARALQPASGADRRSEFVGCTAASAARMLQAAIKQVDREPNLVILVAPIENNFPGIDGMLVVAGGDAAPDGAGSVCDPRLPSGGAGSGRGCDSGMGSATRTGCACAQDPDAVGSGDACCCGDDGYCAPSDATALAVAGTGVDGVGPRAAVLFVRVRPRPEHEPDAEAFKPFDSVVACADGRRAGFVVAEEADRYPTCGPVKLPIAGAGLTQYAWTNRARHML